MNPNYGVSIGGGGGTNELFVLDYSEKREWREQYKPLARFCFTVESRSVIKSKYFLPKTKLFSASTIRNPKFTRAQCWLNGFLQFSLALAKLAGISWAFRPCSSRKLAKISSNSESRSHGDLRTTNTWYHVADLQSCEIFNISLTGWITIYSFVPEVKHSQ